MREKDTGSSEVKTSEIDDIELRAVRWFNNRAVTVLKLFYPLPK